jgi:RNA polymerase sigma factor (sigma-70 family)
MLNVKENYVSDIMAISREVISLEKMVETDSGIASPLGSCIVDNRYDSPDQAMLKKSLIHDIERLLDTLDNKEAEIIRLHFGLGKNPPMSLQEIGEQFNLTKERIRQIEAKALLRLQNLSRKAKLESYVA